MEGQEDNLREGEVMGGKKVKRVIGMEGGEIKGQGEGTDEGDREKEEEMEGIPLCHTFKMAAMTSTCCCSVCRVPTSLLST